jgi:hypothetical protein
MGDDGANAAWLLVQHAGRDPVFQRQLTSPARPWPVRSSTHTVCGRPQSVSGRVATAKPRWGGR